jgi:hypothetical protein
MQTIYMASGRAGDGKCCLQARFHAGIILNVKQ